MNTYERIQQSLDYIEQHLHQPLVLEEAAARACFSLSHYYRMFHALVGYSVKEFVRRRRLTDAATRLVTSGDRIIDISLDCQFETQESFSRAFKLMFGTSPGRFRKEASVVDGLDPLDLLDRYYAPEEEATPVDPRIKVLKDMPPMRVACCRVVSASPEQQAITLLLDWARSKAHISPDSPYRLFGYDSPSPTGDSGTYGYEACMTVARDVSESDGITIKELPGGLYAVTGTTVAGVKEAWRHFVAWLKISKYTEGRHQCLEEQLSPAGTPEEQIQIDLYLPLTKR
jgi:AraC-like DNA-binding protein/DNA gyrase inhibitor GyrI